MKIMIGCKGSDVSKNNNIKPVYARWEIEKKAVTFGDNYFVCSNCKQGGHCYGVENLTPHPKICPNCEAIMINSN